MSVLQAVELSQSQISKLIPSESDDLEQRRQKSIAMLRLLPQLKGCHPLPCKCKGLKVRSGLQTLEHLWSLHGSAAALAWLGGLGSPDTHEARSTPA